MKRSEHIAHLKKISLPDLKREIETLDRNIQSQKFTVAFGKSKQVRQIREFKRQLARSLTIANMKLRETMTDEGE